MYWDKSCFDEFHPVTGSLDCLPKRADLEKMGGWVGRARRLVFVLSDAEIEEAMGWLSWMEWEVSRDFGSKWTQSQYKVWSQEKHEQNRPSEELLKKEFEEWSQLEWHPDIKYFEEAGLIEREQGSNEYDDMPLEHFRYEASAFFPRPYPSAQYLSSYSCRLLQLRFAVDLESLETDITLQWSQIFALAALAEVAGYVDSFERREYVIPNMSSGDYEEYIEDRAAGNAWLAIIFELVSLAELQSTIEFTSYGNTLSYIAKTETSVSVGTRLNMEKYAEANEVKAKCRHYYDDLCNEKPDISATRAAQIFILENRSLVDGVSWERPERVLRDCLIKLIKQRKRFSCV